MIAFTEEDLHELYVWVDSIPLSKPKKNISRDFADGCCVAEILYYYFPKLVQLHNYAPAMSSSKKKDNWETLNNKVLRKLYFEVPPDEVEEIISAVPGAIERFLRALKVKIDQVLATKQQYEAQQQQQQQKDYEEEEMIRNGGGAAAAAGGLGVSAAAGGGGMKNPRRLSRRNNNNNVNTSVDEYEDFYGAADTNDGYPSNAHNNNNRGLVGNYARPGANNKQKMRVPSNNNNNNNNNNTNNAGRPSFNKGTRLSKIGAAELTQNNNNNNNNNNEIEKFFDDDDINALRAGNQIRKQQQQQQQKYNISSQQQQQQMSANSPLNNNNNNNVNDSVTVAELQLLLNEKDRSILELRETVGILSEKILKLEELSRVKDEKLRQYREKFGN